MRKFATFLGICSAWALAGWAQAPVKKAAAPPKAAVAAKPPALAPGLYGTMTTSMGVIRFKLHEKESPITVKNFVDLALGRKQWRNPQGQMVRTPLYNGVTFHRVIPGFMIQGGDPTATGAGEVGFVIDDEYHPSLSFDKPGVFGMANAGPRTGSSQFFITETPQERLTGRHTIFAQVISGQSVVDQIARVPRDDQDKPRTGVRILHITFQRVGPAPPNAPEGAPARMPAKAPLKKAAPAPKKK
jgi:peptidyl-prolyl cis-trans isomerase A (cyclophilin A)